MISSGYRHLDFPSGLSSLQVLQEYAEKPEEFY
jgi:hypothetical protein